MILDDFYFKHKSKNECLEFLEKIRWKEGISCPYCNSNYFSILKNEKRYHCNTCNTSFSVTVGTIFHNTKCDLQKWFYAIYLYINNEKGISSRALSKELNVTKDTAWFMFLRIRYTIINDKNFLQKCIE